MHNLTPSIARLLRCAALSAALILPLGAHAIIGGAGPDPNVATSPWAGVGSVQTAGGSFSGALIAPGYVLTAAHVVADQSASNVSFVMYAGATYTIAASQIFINPGYAGFVPGADGTVHNDLAIIRLGNEAPAGVPFYRLYESALKAHDILTFVGYGGSSYVKRTGENRADLLLPGSGGSTEVYAFDYDGPDLGTNRIGANIASNGTLGTGREATFEGGDSGSPAFIMDPSDGTWKLAAVDTFIAFFGQGPNVPGAFGTGGGGQVVMGYANWINSVVMAPVPEPETYALLLGGLGLLVLVARRRHGEAR